MVLRKSSSDKDSQIMGHFVPRGSLFFKSKETAKILKEWLFLHTSMIRTTKIGE